MSAPRRTKRSSPRVACDPATELKARLAAVDAFVRAMFGEGARVLLNLDYDEHAEAMRAAGAEVRITEPWQTAGGYPFPAAEHVALEAADGRVEVRTHRPLPAEEKAS